MPPLIDLSGQRFGRLVAVSRTVEDKRSRWTCRCDCGNEISVLLQGLRSGITRSCGCDRVHPGLVHGMYGTPTYKSWQSMIERCTNPNNHAWSDYGGRGITVCQRWREGFVAFYEDMGERPPGRSLDRIDNNLRVDSYSKANCRWATRSEQTRNRRRSVVKLERHEPDQIAWLVNECGYKARVVAEFFGISRSHAAKIAIEAQERAA